MYYDLYVCCVEVVTLILHNTTEPSLTFLAMAGTFNSGTNLLASLMIRNCQIDERMKVYGEKQKGMRWQVKWVRFNIVFAVCLFC
jgi:hypothetical protein